MTVHLDWPPDLVDRLAEQAREQGLSLDEYLLQAVLEKPRNASVADTTARRLARQEAGRRIRELRKGNVLGPDLTIRDLLEEGRES